MKYSHNGGLVKVLTCGSICWCHRHTRSHQFGISSEADFQMSEGSEKKHVTVARSTDSHPKDGESASTKSTLVVQHRNLSRPSPHSPLHLLHLKPSPFLWHATPSSISHPTPNLWSNPLIYDLTLLFNASTNTTPISPLVQPTTLLSMKQFSMLMFIPSLFYTTWFTGVMFLDQTLIGIVLQEAKDLQEARSIRPKRKATTSAQYG